MNSHHSEKDLLKKTAKLEKELAAKNHELKIEAALEKVRTVVMKMNKPNDLVDVCKVLYKQLLLLGFSEMRNAMINIHNDADKSFINYDYSDGIGKSINHLTFTIHPLVEKQIKKIRSASDAFSETYFTGKDLIEWKKFRKQVGEKNDPRITKNKGLYYYFYSIGIGSIGISTFGPLSKEKKALLKRFRNVFQLSYQRHIDIEQAEAQAREAQIEAALEKVRSQSLAMHRSSEFQKVANILFEKINELQIETDACAIVIFHCDAREFEYWFGNADFNNTTSFKIPYLNYRLLNETWSAIDSKKELLHLLLTGSEKREFFKGIFERTDFRTLSDKRKKMIMSASGYVFAIALNEYTGIQFNRYSSEFYSEDALNILKRFARVFEQAYRRFLDLQKAEAQAMEARIEAALEKIRSRSLAMHKSDELSEVIAVVFEKLNELITIKWDGTSILIPEKESKDIIEWVAAEGHSYPEYFKTPYIDNPMLSELLRARDSGADHFSRIFSFDEKNTLWKHAFENSGYKNLPEDMKKRILESDSYAYSVAFEKNSAIVVASISGQVLPEKEVEILKRFARAFEQSYIRFLDLQKAEAQAREAQIQLALERVRAKSLAMHHTSELQDVVNVVAEQLHNINLDINGGVFICINDQVDNDIPLWASSGATDYVQRIIVPFVNKPILSRLRNAIKQKNNFLAEDYSHEEKIWFFEHLFNHDPWNSAPKKRKQELLLKEGGYARSVAVAKFTSIAIINHTGKKFSDQDNEILKRFGNVFEQSFIRFLDLQKAEAQARESQIEAALERIRSRSLMMQRSEELKDVVAVVFEKLRELGLDFDGTGIQLFTEGSKDSLLWIKGVAVSTPVLVKHPYDEEAFNNSEILSDIWQAKESGEPVFHKPYSFEEKNKLLDYIGKFNKENGTPPDVIEAMVQAPNYTATFIMEKNSGLWIDSWSGKKITNEEFNVSKRIAKVFEQAYIRFLDLQKAEAQAREAKIEAALERVRYRAMAMQTSNDVGEATSTMFVELDSLGIETFRCGIAIVYGDEMEVWSMGNTGDGATVKGVGRISYHLHPLWIYYMNEWKKKTEVSYYYLAGKEKEDYVRILTSMPSYNLTDTNLHFPDLHFQAYYFNEGSIFTFSLHPHSEADKQVMKRFANVFGLTFRRYRDLQKAEAQSRESQIQLALERVRARTMAMQKSDELSDAVYVLFQQFKELGENPDQATIGVINEDEKVIDYWVTMYGQPINKVFKFSIDEPNVTNKIYKAWKENKRSLVIDLSGNALAEFMAYRANKGGAAANPDEKRRIINVAFFSKGLLNVQSNEERSEESIKLLERFASVFEQTYTRFLDLQKAEAQAREAQIEASLERVRSKTMAMHNSEDVGETVATMFAEFVHLDIRTNRCGILIFNDEHTAEVWTARSTEEGKAKLIIGKLDLEIHQMLSSVGRAWKHKEAFYQYELVGEDLIRYYTAINNAKFYPTQFDLKALLPKEFHSDFFFTDGAVFSFTNEPVAEEHAKIMKRFAGVFGQTYRRYLDLQKAEAQARENQIQLALERVRARTMAMQKSDELQETSSVLFEQMKALGEPAEQLSIGIMNEAENVVEISATLEGKNFHQTFRHSSDEPLVMNKIVKAWKTQQKSLTIEQSTEELEAYNKFRNELTGSVKFPTKLQPGDRRILYVAFFSKGMLGLSTPESRPKESLELLERFAGVFDLTYTRFLDLKNAEAQVREAQIEAALERVRSRTMAMHKSFEVTGIAVSLNEELWKLGFQIGPQGGVSILIIDKETGDTELWTGFSEDKTLKSCYVPYFQHPFHDALINAWEKGEKFLVYTLVGDEKTSLDNHYFATGFKDFPESDKSWMRQMESVTFSLAFMKYGAIHWAPNHLTEEQLGILERFSKVFEQSYTRFLDLQKAEAQARESQIQLALERVRARTMAMQHSDELKSAATLLFQQAKTLGVPAYSCGYNIWEENENVFTSWMSTQDGTDINAVLNIPLTEDANFIRFAESRKKGEPFFVLELRGERMQEHYRYLKTIPEFKAYFDYAVSVGFALPETQMHHIANFSHGNLLFITLEPCPEFHEVFKRFAQVFDQTYTRFLDLQKAEAQARESQIQLALERVRARTMAMQKSDELFETAQILFQQFTDLGESPIQITIGIVNEPKGVIEFSVTDWSGGGAQVNRQFSVDINEPTLINKIYKAWKQQKTSLVVDLSGKELDKWLSYRNAISGVHVSSNDTKGRRVITNAFFSKGHLTFSAPEPRPKETVDILERFASTFDLTYTRFLDLQKAEAQAREAQIEAALERVRARAMAMHNSQDLNETIKVFYEQVALLSLKPRHCGVGLFNKVNRIAEVSTMNTTEQNETVVAIGQIDLTLHPILNDIYENWLIQKDYFPILRGNEIKGYYEAIKPHLNYPDYSNDSVQFGYFFYFNEGTIYTWTTEALSENEIGIYRRFSSVISLTYKRYTDLQKAEAQAKEAQIEAALERVRARTMAMHNSEDVSAATATMFTELEKLGVENLRCGITTIHKNKTQEVWSVSNIMSDVNGNTIEKKIVLATGTFDMNAHPLWRLLYEKWDNKEDLMQYYLAGKDKEDYFKILNTKKDYLPEAIQQFPDTNFQVYFFNEGAVWSVSLQPHSEEHKQIMKRFTSVFSLTFRRYQDLKKAEAQAREANIEAGLERVRSRAMAMQSSEELAALIGTVFTELTKLDLALTRCVIWIFNTETNGATWWMANSEDSQNPISCDLPYNAYEPYLVFLEQWQKKAIKFQYELSGTTKKDWDDHLFSKTGLSRLPAVVIEGMKAPERVFLTASFNSFGALNAATLEPLSGEHIDVLLRFAKVFDLTYTRFNDLKQAETQAREATIEAALERVRAKAMAMHNSNDLSVTASMVFTELRKLGINPIRCGVGLLNKESHKAQLYSATSSENGDSLSLVGWVQLEDHPVLEKIYDSWLQQYDYFPELHGKQLQSYYQLLLAGLSVPVPDFSNEQKQYGHFISFSVGCLYAWSDEHYNDDQIKILKRFASIIDLTFRRYLELQKSEANAKEALKQSALDRIRADIASMRTVSDLDRITPLIWNELTILGINFIRCGVFIMDDSQKQIHTFLSTPDGKAIAAFHLPYSAPGNIQKVINHWHDNKNYIDHWDESEFTQFGEMLVQQKALSSAEEYLKTIPHGGFYLHFLPFLQGMLYVGNTTQLNDDEIKLIQSVADAFSTAYARYEDFNKLEAAKHQIEETLVDLKQAQTQLVQSEKMASLGELTAGIAHEIQNPLNFVNNFSDVSNELIDEMKQELETGNWKLASEIAEDVKQNLEKIIHHGKRADAIVKGMLQHSRTSSGQKELTDINALCDEYVRLAYHGLRAKDKSFNAKFETHFDPTIEKMNVVPQDIGRVLLNLINNAFYTVSKKQKAEGLKQNAEYKPIVSIKTKKYNSPSGVGGIEISVKDNGSGIPQNIIDKIFQPFFTTKPTGQGTGLGLSLSYDIIKAHGGEIKVNTRENEGSEFIISLPKQTA